MRREEGKLEEGSGGGKLGRRVVGGKLRRGEWERENEKRGVGEGK